MSKHLYLKNLRIKKLTNGQFVIGSILSVFTFLILIKQPGFQPYSFSEISILLFSLTVFIVNLKRFNRLNGYFMLTLVLILTISLFILLVSLKNIEPAFLSLSLHIKYMLLIPFVAIYSGQQRDKYFGIIVILIMGFIAMIPTLFTIISNPNSLLELVNPSGSFARNSGTFPNPNMLGSYLFVLILCSTFMVEKVERKAHRIILIGLIAFFLILLILTFSRRSWFITIVMTFSYLLIRKGSKIIPLVLLSLMSIVISKIIDVKSIILRLFTIFDSSYESNSIRNELLSSILGNLQRDSYQFISGLGPGKIGIITQFIGKENFSQIDSYPLLILGEYGLIGIILYYSLILSILIIGIRGLFRSSTKLRVLEICIFLGLSIIGIVGLTPITFPLNLLQAIFGGYILSNNFK